MPAAAVVLLLRLHHCGARVGRLLAVLAITGGRVRNYDGLDGQLLFAFLHREGYLHWTHNRLTIDWNTVAEGVGQLRERVHDLYHSGIDRSSWASGLPPTTSSPLTSRQPTVWAAARRDLPEVEEPKQLVNLVRDDESPLSLFYGQLQPKLEPALTRSASSIADSRLPRTREFGLNHLALAG